MGTRGFYSTADLGTERVVGGPWSQTDDTETDCDLVVLPDGRVRSIPMDRMREGDRIVVSRDGIRVEVSDGGELTERPGKR